jgi:hypothetical protein
MMLPENASETLDLFPKLTYLVTQENYISNIFWWFHSVWNRSCGGNQCKTYIVQAWRVVIDVYLQAEGWSVCYMKLVQFSAIILDAEMKSHLSRHLSRDDVWIMMAQELICTTNCKCYFIVKLSNVMIKWECIHIYVCTQSDIWHTASVIVF